MAKAKGVSGKTHTKAQLDAYANMNNPNNKAYKANQRNQAKMRQQGRNTRTYDKYDVGELVGESFGWCDD